LRHLENQKRSGLRREKSFEVSRGVLFRDPGLDKEQKRMKEAAFENLTQPVRNMEKPGFTLIELIIAVVIIGILASIALPRFVRVVEKGRSGEARNALGVIRDAQMAYFLEWDAFTACLTSLGVPVPVACNADFYFAYSVATAGAPASLFTATAARCTAGGRSPNSPLAYSMTLTNTGVLNSTVANIL
jgi:prepilin-type N-terminal cleavage/methylation domain-containing protein